MLDIDGQSMLKKFILFNNLQHYIDHYWASLDMAEVDALSAKDQFSVVPHCSSLYKVSPVSR